ncbi:unnamed protein product [Fusarium venenatum]|uniref:Uncharacterized protein n=1 Tax=Fusarium venenatum TaxID=56646 RepID=A0A2L2SRU1_9HYPO|nr:uncharacterized protein FVRRES_12432 [Fusarium venenatum]CEI39741.1 unnamed protein product [Fusarium venenatum]
MSYDVNFKKSIVTKPSLSQASERSSTAAHLYRIIDTWVPIKEPIDCKRFIIYPKKPWIDLSFGSPRGADMGPAGWDYPRLSG